MFRTLALALAAFLPLAVAATSPAIAQQLTLRDGFSLSPAPMPWAQLTGVSGWRRLGSTGISWRYATDRNWSYSRATNLKIEFFNGSGQGIDFSWTITTSGYPNSAGRSALGHGQSGWTQFYVKPGNQFMVQVFNIVPRRTAPARTPVSSTPTRTPGGANGGSNGQVPTVTVGVRVEPTRAQLDLLQRYYGARMSGVGTSRVLRASNGTILWRASNGWTTAGLTGLQNASRAAARRR